MRTITDFPRNEAGLVDKFIGTAYDTVKFVADNMEQIKFIFDFMSKYNVLICLDDATALPALDTRVAKFARVYDTDAVIKRYDDYIYMPNDTSGILPVTGTGSWVLVAGSGGGSGAGESVPWLYNDGQANGGEETIHIDFPTAGVPEIYINGVRQTLGLGYTFNILTNSITVAEALTQGDELVAKLWGLPALPGIPTIDDYKYANWLYNNGAAIGGEVTLNPPYIFAHVPAVFKNGLRLVEGIGYTADATNFTITMAVPLVTGDTVVAQLGGELDTTDIVDSTLQQVARAVNLPDQAVILSSNRTESLFAKQVIYDVVAQRAWSLPSGIPAGAKIETVSNSQLTYSPGSVVVTLLPAPDTTYATLAVLAKPSGAAAIGASTGGTVQQNLDNLSESYSSIKRSDGFYLSTFTGAKQVNIPGDYPNMQAAVDDLHIQTTAQGLYIVLNLQAGYREKIGLKVQHGDFSRFYIKSEDATVSVADDFIGVVGPDGGSTITSGSVIMAYHAKGPVLGCIFDGRQIARTLYFALGGSHGWADRLQSSTEETPNPVRISGGRNFRHATFQAQEASVLVCENTVGTGCMLNSYYCERNSTIHCEFSDASNSLQAGVMATRASRVNADTMNVAGCKIGMWASRGAQISAADVIANNCSVYGFYADMGANINAHNASALNAGTNIPGDTSNFVNPGAACHAYRGSKINFSSGKASGSLYGISAVINSEIAAFGIQANTCVTAAAFARYCSSISMDNGSVSGSLAAGIVASDASTISFNTGNITNTVATAVSAVNASKISAASAVVNGAATGIYSDASSNISAILSTVTATVGLRVNRGGFITATGATYSNANISINTLNANGIIFA